MGGRYLRKRLPGVSNMRQHSPPNTLHLSIWPLSELISWRIKTNRRDPMASGCLRCSLPRPLSPPGMGLIDKGHCVGHLDCHTPHLPCHVVRFDEVIWQRERNLTINVTATKHAIFDRLLLHRKVMRTLYYNNYSRDTFTVFPVFQCNTSFKLARGLALEGIKST